ncbi:MAG: glutathione S-transferase family protein [Bermanella sp.]
MLLDNKDIQTEEVKHWQGLHLLFFPLSSCSQKVRILLKEKRIPFTPHPIDLKKGEQTTPWFLGINARGVVPVLINNGQVHIESNDILFHLDKEHPSDQPTLLPRTSAQQALAETMLDMEDKMHDHMRVITMEYLAPSKMMRKSDQQLKNYSENGVANNYRKKQVDWWRQFSSKGISSEQINGAVLAFNQSLSWLDHQLKDHNYLLGKCISIVDISWFITLHRLSLAGYPMHLHPHLKSYYQKLLKRPHFRKEVSSGSWPLRTFAWLFRKSKRLTGPSLTQSHKLLITD